MILTKELIELATALIIVLALSAVAISYYMLDAGRVGFSEKYTMEDLDRVSLSYLAKSCFEKSGNGRYIDISYLDTNQGDDVEELCGINKASFIKIIDRSGETVKEWTFDQDILFHDVEESHSIFVNIGENENKIWVGEMIVSV